MEQQLPIFSYDDPQLASESGTWFNRYLIYRNMPATSRTLLGAVHLYELAQSGAKRSKSVPGAWHSHWQGDNWLVRAEAYDKARRQHVEAQEEQERQAILAHGYAKMHRRIQKLDALADKLELLIEEEDRLWLPDVKSVGTGPTAERVDLITFNDALIREYRAALADIAAELGERVKMSKADVSGTLDLAHRAVFVLPELDDEDVAAQEPTGETA